MPRYLSGMFAALIVGMLIGGPYVYYRYRQKEYRNFRVVREGVLYRCGQLNPNGLAKVIHDHQIKTVVSFRYADNPADPPPDIAEETWCRNHGVNYFRVRPRKFAKQDGWAPADESVREFIAIMKNEHLYPVLVHCYAGRHRTGGYVAIYRMEFEHWTNAEAIAEVRHAGYTTLDDDWDVLEYLEQYRPGKLREVSAGSEEAEPDIPPCRQKQ